jgi:hypothetical protein
MCWGFVVSASAHVTAGCARMYLSENYAQLRQSNAPTHSGSGWPRTRPK